MAVRYHRPGRSGGGPRTLVLGLVVGLAAGVSLVSLFARHATTTTVGSDLPGSTAQQAGGAGRWRRPEATLPREVYSLGPSTDRQAAEAVAALLSEGDLRELRELCGRTLYHSLQTGWVSHETGAWTWVATGDLPLMWIRDSAVQINVLLPRLARHPQLRRVVEGAIRAQAFFILQDPYANGYEPEWRHPESRHKGDRTAGRGGWVGVRNYELDSGAYYLNLLWNYFLTPGLYRADALIAEPMIFDAASLLVDVWVREQRHNESSPYRFKELGNEGLGPTVQYTGMTWSGFRPSDDASQHGFPIPANMYAAAGLERALELNRQVWQVPEFEAKAGRLLADIKQGIESHGIVTVSGERVYAYEVDGRGAALTDFDDPNVPSLVSVPLLGYPYDKEVYAATRRRLLDPATNGFYFNGSEFHGMGSPHTSHGFAWALGIYTEVLTATTLEEKAAGLRTLLKLQCGDGLMHESVHVDDLKRCTRKWFEWANALLAITVEHLLGFDCDAAAQAFHRGYTKGREEKEGGARDPNIFAPFHAAMQWDGVYKSKVADWAGIGHVIPIEGGKK